MTIRGASSSSIVHSHNITILFKIRNYSIWAIEIHFSLRRVQAIEFINVDLLEQVRKVTKRS